MLWALPGPGAECPSPVCGGSVDTLPSPQPQVPHPGALLYWWGGPAARGARTVEKTDRRSALPGLRTVRNGRWMVPLGQSGCARPLSPQMSWILLWVCAEHTALLKANGRLQSSRLICPNKFAEKTVAAHQLVKRPMCWKLLDKNLERGLKTWCHYTCDN